MRLLLTHPVYTGYSFYTCIDQRPNTQKIDNYIGHFVLVEDFEPEGCGSKPEFEGKDWKERRIRI